MFEEFLIEVNNGEEIVEEGWLKDAATWTKDRLVEFGQRLGEKIEKAWTRFLNWIKRKIVDIKKALAKNKVMCKLFHLEKFKEMMKQQDDDPKDNVDPGNLTCKINGKTYSVTVESASDDDDNSKISKAADLYNDMKNGGGDGDDEDLVDASSTIQDALDNVSKRINSNNDDMNTFRENVRRLRAEKEREINQNRQKFININSQVRTADREVNSKIDFLRLAGKIVYAMNIIFLILGTVLLFRNLRSGK